MHHLVFDLIRPSDISSIQQMIQGTQHSCLRFSYAAPVVFVARHEGNIAGFTYGQKGYGDDAHILTIRGTYLRQYVDDEHHSNELRLAFVNWASRSLGITHYKFDELDTPKSRFVFPALSRPAAPATQKSEKINTLLALEYAPA